MWADLLERPIEFMGDYSQDIVWATHGLVLLGVPIGCHEYEEAYCANKVHGVDDDNYGCTECIVAAI